MVNKRVLHPDWQARQRGHQVERLVLPTRSSHMTMEWPQGGPKAQQPPCPASAHCFEHCRHCSSRGRRAGSFGRGGSWHRLWAPLGRWGRRRPRPQLPSQSAGSMMGCSALLQICMAKTAPGFRRRSFCTSSSRPTSIIRMLCMETSLKSRCLAELKRCGVQTCHWLSASQALTKNVPGTFEASCGQHAMQ